MEMPRQLADRVIQLRKKAWERSDPTVVIATTETMTPEDEQTIRKVVSEAGYSGNEFEEVVRNVTGLIVRRVEALNDQMPATNAD